MGPSVPYSNGTSISELLTLYKSKKRGCSNSNMDATLDEGRDHTRRSKCPKTLGGRNDEITTK